MPEKLHMDLLDGWLKVLRIAHFASNDLLVELDRVAVLCEEWRVAERREFRGQVPSS